MQQEGISNKRLNLDNFDQWASIIFDMSPIGITVADENGSYIFANPACCKMMGYTAEELLQMTIFDLTHPDDRELTKSAIKVQFEGTFIRGIEKRSICKNGDVIWVSVSSRVIEDKEGNHRYILGMTEDITERKRAEETIQASEDRFRRLSENSPDMIYRMSLPDGRYEYVSPACVEITGYTPEECYQNPLLVRNTIHPDWRAYFVEAWNKLLEGDVDPTYEYPIIDKSGNIKWLQQRNVLVKKEGVPVAIEGIVTDVTKNKEIQEKLRVSEDKSRTFIENSPAGMVLTDEEGIVIEWNPTLEQLSGFKRVEVLGKSTWDVAFQLLKPEDRTLENYEILKRERLDALGSGHSYLFNSVTETILFNLDGTQNLIQRRFFPIKTQKGYRLGAVYIDINEQRRIENALKESEERYRTLIECIPAITYQSVFGESGITLYISPQIENLGLTVDDWQTYQDWLSWLHPEDRQRVKTEYDRTLGRGERFSAEYRIFNREGQIFWVHDEAAVVSRDEGKSYIQGIILDISEHKRAEQAMHASEEHFRSIHTQSPIGIELYDLDGFLMDVNPACLDIFGVGTIEEVKGFKLFDDPNIPSGAKQSLLEGKKVEYEAIFDFDLVREKKLYQTTKSGQAYLKCQITPYDTDNDVPGGFLVHVQDITEQKRSQQALAEGEEFVRTIFNSVEEGILVCDRDLCFMSWNPFMERLTGRKAAGVLGKNALEVFPFLRQLGMEEVNEKILKGETVIISDTFFDSDGDGQGKWARGIYSPHRNMEGEIIGSVIVLSDTTDYIQSQQQLEKVHTELERVSNTISDCVWSMLFDPRDQSTNFTYLSSPFERITGYPAELMIQDPFLRIEMLHPDDRQPFIQALENVVTRNVDTVELEQRLTRKDGNVIWVRNHAVATPEENGCLRIDGILSDITARKLAEDQIHKSEIRNRALTEAMPDALFEVTSDGIVVDYKSAPGFKPFVPSEVFIGKNLQKVLPKDVVEIVMSGISKVCQSGDLITLEYQLMEDSCLRDYEARIVPHAQNVLAIVRDITNRKEMERLLQRRDAVLEAISISAQRLLQPDDWDATVQDMLSRLGKVLEVEHGRIYQIDQNAGMTAHILHEWDALETPIPAENETNKPFPFWTIYQHDGSAKSGFHRVIKGHTDQFQRSVRDALKRMQIQSIIMVPILVNKEFWGVLLFDISTHEREFSAAEEDALVIAANTFGAALQRREIAMALKVSEERYRTLVNITPDAIIFFDLDGKIILMNKQAAVLGGLDTIDPFIGKNVQEFVAIEDRKRFEENLKRVQKIESIKDLEYNLIRHPGIVFPAEGSMSVVKDEQGKPIGFIVDFRDISERRITDSALQSSMLSLKSYVDTLKYRNRVSTLSTEMFSRLQDAREVQDLYDITGDYMEKLFPEQAGFLAIYEASEDKIQTAVTWGDIVDTEMPLCTEDCWAFKQGSAHLISDSQSRLRCKKVDAETYACVPLIRQNEKMGVLHLQDVTDHPKDAWKLQTIMTIAESLSLMMTNIKLRQTLEYQSNHDFLTGLFNRRYFGEIVEREIMRVQRHGRPLSVLICDIDHFKKTNDMYGHLGGDEVLRTIGKFLLANIRREDIVCRFGGDEIIIIFPESPLEESYKRALEIFNGIRKIQFSHEFAAIGKITFSVGIAAYPQHGQSIEEILKVADKSLYEAKKKGGDCVVVAD
ncbi:MAG: PAS domain S-box protein [Chloroflexota bacterium]